MQRPTFQILLPCLLALLLPACASTRIASQWHPQPIDLAGNERDWVDLPWNGQGDLALRALNDGTRLTLNLSTGVTSLKAQWMGLFNQTLTIWIDPEGHHQRTHGLRLTVMPPPGQPYPTDDAQEWAYLNACVVSAALVGPADAATAVSPSAQGLDWEIHGTNGKVVVQLALPLAWGLGTPLAVERKPGQPISIGIETSAIDPGLGQAVLARSQRPEAFQDAPAQAPRGRHSRRRRMGDGEGDDSGGGRGANGGELTRVPDPIQVWAVVQLARGASDPSGPGPRPLPAAPRSTPAGPRKRL